MKDVTQFSSETLKRIIQVKRKIERLESQLEKLTGGSGSVGAPRQRRQMSAAGRKAISDAAKARWARERAAKAGK